MIKKLLDRMPSWLKKTLGVAATVGAIGGGIAGYLLSPSATEPDAQIYIQWACGNDTCATLPYSQYGAEAHFHWSKVDSDFAYITDYLARLGAIGRKGGFVIDLMSIYALPGEDHTINLWTPSGYAATKQVCKSANSGTCADKCITMPAFDNASYRNGYLDFIARLGAQFDGNANLEFVEISDGAHNESSPMPAHGIRVDGVYCNFYNEALGAIGGGDYFWGEWSKLVIQAYRDAFPSHFVYWQGGTVGTPWMPGILDVLKAESDPVGYKFNGFWGEGARNFWVDRTGHTGTLQAIYENIDDIPFAAEMKNFPGGEQETWTAAHQVASFRPDFLVVQNDGDIAAGAGSPWINIWQKQGVLSWLEDRLGQLPTEDDLVWWVPHVKEKVSGDGDWYDWPYDYGTLTAMLDVQTDRVEREFRWVQDYDLVGNIENVSWRDVVPAAAREDKRARHIAVLEPGEKLWFQVGTDWKFYCAPDGVAKYRVKVDYLDNDADTKVVFENSSNVAVNESWNGAGTDAFLQHTSAWLTTPYICQHLSSRFKADFSIENTDASVDLVIVKVEIEGDWVDTPDPTNTHTPTPTPSSTPTHTPTATATPIVGSSWYVATDGDDGDAGTLAAPFLTLGKAKTAVAAAISGGMTEDATVFIRGGTYYLDSTLSLGTADSGVDGYDVVWKNYADEVPVIIGGEELTNWSLASGSIYRKYVGRNFYALMEDGVMSVLAREPDDTYLTVDRQISAPCTGCGGKATFGYAAGDLPSFTPDDASVYVKLGSQGTGEYYAEFYPEVLEVNNVNVTQRTIEVLKHVTWYPIQQDDHYYVRGALEFLDSPGEWYLDSSSGYVYYWPRSGDRDGIVAATVDRIVEVKGDAVGGPYAGNIKFEGLTFRFADFGPRNWLSPNAAQKALQEDALVYVENASSVVVNNCVIENAPWDGVALRQYAQSNEVTRNTIRNVGRQGVSLTGMDEGSLLYVNKSNTVSNNRLTGGTAGGVWVGDADGAQSAAIGLQFSGENTISHNEIAHWPRMGISLTETGWKTFHDEYAACPTCWDYMHGVTNTISFNEVSYVLEDSNDGGGIFIHNGGKGNVVDNNIVHDIVSNHPEDPNTHGIYLDAWASWVTVSNNIIYGIGGKPGKPLTVKGASNTITNNIIVKNTTRHDVPNLPLDSWNSSKRNEATGIVFGQHDYTYNIFFRNEGDLGHYFRFFDYNSSEALNSADYNVYYHPRGTVRFRTGHPTTGTNYTLAEWQGEGWEANSITTDPMFVDYDNNDYTLKPGSPALTLGFQNIDVTGVGIIEADPPDPPDPDPTNTPTPTATAVDTPVPTPDVRLQRRYGSAVADTYIDSASATTNWGSRTELWLDEDSLSILLDYSSAMRHIPSTAAIRYSFITLEVNRNLGDDLDIAVYTVLRDWNGSQATWNIAKNGVNWGTAGAKGAADRGAPSYTETIDQDSGSVQIDITDIVADWADGTSADYGLLIEGTSGTGVLSFRSREDRAPRIRIDYYEGEDQPTATPTPTATLTPTPEVLVGLTPPANPVYPSSPSTIWKYRMEITNSDGTEQGFGVVFRPPSGVEFAVGYIPGAPVPVMGWDNERLELSVGGVQLNPGVTTYQAEMDAPSGTEHSAEVEVSRGDWSTYATVVVTPIIAATATPTGTPTPTSTATATETPTVTPTWTATVTPTPWDSAPYIVLNEVIPLPASDHNYDGEVTDDDQGIEFYNRGSSTIDMEYWYVAVYDKDGAEIGSRVFPQGFDIDAASWWVMRPKQLGFYLPSTGGIELYTGTGVLKDSVNWSSQWSSEKGWIPYITTGVSWGRYPDGNPWWMGMKPSPGYSNGRWPTPTPTSVP